jgi:perosamine synthetase
VEPATAAIDRKPFRSVQLLDDEIGEILDLCRGALSTGSLSAGPLVQEFESCFAAESRVPHAVAVSSGTGALEAILRALGVAHRKVLVPTNTFAATAFAVLHAGAQPVFVDMDPRTLAPSPLQVELAFEQHKGDVAAFVLVHIGGFIGEATKDLADLCDTRGVAFVEDAAHAHGSVYRGESPGTLSAAAAYSFFATKVMTSAEGGMVVTRREDIASFVRSYRDQGRDPKDPQINVTPGTNSRLSELHAAVGLAELRRLRSIVAARRRVAEWYDDIISHLPYVASVQPGAGCEPNYYKYILMCDSAEMKSEFQKFASLSGLPLPSGVYDVPLHRQPVFRDRCEGVALPNSEDFCSRHVALPVTRTMQRHDVERVSSVLRDFLF